MFLTMITSDDSESEHSDNDDVQSTAADVPVATTSPASVASNTWTTDTDKQAKRTNPNLKDTELPKRCKTVYGCKSCEVFLCIGSATDNCFEAYHSKVQFWR